MKQGDSATVDFRASVSMSRRFKEIPSYLFLLAGTVLFNLLGAILKPFFKKKKLPVKGRPLRLALIGFGGIGNHLMLVPAIRTIHRFHPEMLIHLLAASAPSAELLRKEASVASVSIDKSFHLKGKLQRLQIMIQQLKSLRPDIVIGAAGLDPVFLSVVSFLGGAQWRIGADWHGRGFLLTHSVPLEGNVYEAEQNLKIASLLIEEPVSNMMAHPSLTLNEEDLRRGRLWRDSLNIDAQAAIVGIHPGTGREQKWKRWKLENFVETARRIEQTCSIKCVFFLGPDEEELEKELFELNISSNQILRESGSILTTASRMMQCRLFISNDSGLRQLAVALGIPSIGIFGPTSTSKNFAADGIHRVVVAEHVLCRPCHYTHWWLACDGDQRCLSDITVEAVVSEALQSLRMHEAKRG
jgi:ADP-heptose:LPS heptosyltransferase